MFIYRPSSKGEIVVCGHRGHSVGGHENSLEALRQAANLGASACEIDLRVTADGKLVVFHDDVLDLASDGKGLIAQLPYEEIAKFKTAARDGRTIEGQRIELYEDILSLSRSLGLKLIIEIKDQSVDAAYLEKVVDPLIAQRMIDDVLISSFDHVVLLELKSRWPKLRTMGINYHRLVDPVGTAKTARMDVLNTDYPQFTAGMGRALQGAEIGVSHYVPRPEYFALRQRYGADYLVTLKTYLEAGLIDMIVCDDVAWSVNFAESCGRKVIAAQAPSN